MLIATLPGEPSIFIKKSSYVLSSQNSLQAILASSFPQISMDLTVSLNDEKQERDEVFIKNLIVMSDLIEAKIISSPVRIIESECIDYYVCRLLK